MAERGGACYLLRPMTSPRHVLLTGGTGALGRSLLRRLGAQGHTVSILVRKNSRRGARTWLTELRKQEPETAGRVRILCGDLAQPGLFDDPAERAMARDEVDTIVHCGAATHAAVDRRIAYDTNVTGTRGVIEFAREVKTLRRLVHLSCASVSGSHHGVLREDELLVGQRFESRMAESKMVAERKARAAMAEFPVTVLRTGHLVGDSRTGFCERVDGPYHLFLFALKLARLPRALRMLPLAPGGHEARIQCVPINFVVDATAALIDEEAAAGRCLSLTDPFALTVREWFDLLAERLELVPFRVSVPAGWAGAALRSPALGPLRSFLDQGLDLPVEVLLQVATRTVHDTTEAERLLRPRGIQPPHAPDWIDPVLTYARETFL